MSIFFPLGFGLEAKQVLGLFLPIVYLYIVYKLAKSLIFSVLGFYSSEL